MIRNIILRGFGNGTFSGTIPQVVTRGYLSAAPSGSGPSAVLTQGFGSWSSGTLLTLGFGAATLQASNSFLLGDIDSEPQIVGTFAVTPQIGGTIVFNELAR